jgi:hypothetical protein
LRVFLKTAVSIGHVLKMYFISKLEENVHFKVKLHIAQCIKICEKKKKSNLTFVLTLAFQMTAGKEFA